MAGELIAGGAIGALTGEVLKLVIHVIKNGVHFKSSLEKVRSQLEYMSMLMKHLDELGNFLNYPANTNNLKYLISEGDRHIRKCDNVKNTTLFNLHKLPIYTHRLRSFDAELHRASHHLALQLLLEILTNQARFNLYFCSYRFIYDNIDKVRKVGGIHDNASEQPHLPLTLYDPHLLKGPSSADRLMGVAVEYMDEENVFKKMIKASTNDRYEKIFHWTFETVAEEKLKRWFRCYYNHTSCPLKGVLYISTKRLTFCSKERIQRGDENELGSYLKVIIPFQLMADDRSPSGMYTSDECLKITSIDKQQFSFEKFMNFNDVKRCLQELLIPSTTCNCCYK